MRRILRAVIVIPVMLVVAVAAVVGILVVTNPGPRDAPGWELRAPMPEARGETTTAVVGGQLYVIGGLAGMVPRTSDAVAIYDPASDTWTDGPALPEPRHHTAAAALEGAIYVAGGAPGLDQWSPETDFWRLDAGDDAWTDAASMPEGRWGHRLAALDGRLWVIGGQGGSGATLVYDPVSDAWETRAPIPENRDHLAVVTVDDEIWAIGGRNGGVRARVDIYNPATDEWRSGPELPAPTSGSAEATAEGLVLVSGGEDPSPVGDGVYDRHWWLDARDVDLGWRAIPRPPLAIHGAEGAVIDQRFYVIGGATRAGGQSFVSWTDATQAFDLAALDR